MTEPIDLLESIGKSSNAIKESIDTMESDEISLLASIYHLMETLKQTILIRKASENFDQLTDEQKRQLSDISKEMESARKTLEEAESKYSNLSIITIAAPPPPPLPMLAPVKKTAGPSGIQTSLLTQTNLQATTAKPGPSKPAVVDKKQPMGAMRQQINLAKSTMESPIALRTAKKIKEAELENEKDEKTKETLRSEISEIEEKLERLAKAADEKIKAIVKNTHDVNESVSKASNIMVSKSVKTPGAPNPRRGLIRRAPAQRKGRRQVSTKRTTTVPPPENETPAQRFARLRSRFAESTIKKGQGGGRRKTRKRRKSKSRRKSKK